jgi:Bifunctional DNA primase/polymerase, N-terminal
MTPAPHAAQHPGPFWATARAHAMTAATLYHHPVIPLTRTKLPAIASAHPDDDTSTCTGQCGHPGHGIHDATADPDQVTVLFRAAPWAAGYAIACGRPPHFLFGLDLDRKHGIDGVREAAALAARHGFALPATATVLTPSGGLHHWLTAPPGTRVPNTAGALAPGIDTRGFGGYLVGPGSLGRTGRYQFAPDRGPRRIAPAPAGLLALLTDRHQHGADGRPLSAARTAGGRRQGLDDLLRAVRNPAPGRNNRLFLAACRAFELPGADAETTAAKLLDAALSTELPQAEAARTIRNARRAAARTRQGAGS